MADAVTKPDRNVAPASEIPLHHLVRRRRREAGLSQQQLCARAGIAQSALSAFERGGMAAQALSSENVSRVAEVLGIALDADFAGVPVPRSRFAVFFCPSPECPATLAYLIGMDGTAYRPRLVRATTEHPLYCGFCGEVCEHSCPGCGSAVLARAGGAFCASCGAAYVAGPGLDPDAVARRRGCRELVLQPVEIVDLRQIHGGPAPAGQP